MTDEERQRAMDFIVAEQATHAVRIDSLLESQRRANRKLERYERILKLMIRAGRRERRIRSEAVARLNEALAAVAFSQAHADDRLDALIDIVRQRHGG